MKRALTAFVFVVSTACGGDDAPADPCAKVTCDANATCSAGVCACNEGFDGDGVSCSTPCTGSNPVEQLGTNVVGCTGVLIFAARDICGDKRHVCTAAEWVAAVNAGATAPTYHYWTDDQLYWSSEGGPSACSVTTDSTNADFKACLPTEPMRVCANVALATDGEFVTDALGNHCNWTQCGYETNTPNYYFGGCESNTTAGALCCLDT